MTIQLVSERQRGLGLNFSRTVRHGRLVVTQLSLAPNIVKKAGDRSLVTMEHQYEMGYGKWNGHVTDVVM